MPHRILLVEDEAILALAEARTIQKYGYEVVTAYTGRETIDLVESDPDISLILMDIDLGRGMDGTETAQRILETHDLPIAFLSSHTEPAIVEKTEGITSYGYIVKNSGETVLIASIKMAFRLYEAHMALKAQKENLRTALVQQEQAEEELLVKTEELDRYFTSSLDMLCSADTNGRLIRLNPEWETVLGYPISELEGRSFMDLVHPDDTEATLKAVERLRQQEEVISFENRYRCRDGSYRWIEWRSKSMGNTIYAAARDITDRKRMVMDLRESEARYRSLFYESPLGAIEFDTEGVITECNDSFIAMNVSSRERLIDFNLLTELQDRELSAQVRKTLDEGSGFYEGNYTSVTGNKQSYLRIFFKGIRDEEGVISSCLCLVEDISEQKTAENELREKTELLRKITDNMFDMIAITDMQGNFTFLGKSHEVLGYDLAFLLGRNVLDFVHPDDLQE
ncbi:MAG: PAS domain S-box protein, partial [Spirochaetota bacterium]|nr:PAS domain S-box protein [Spirochaetota bacterium]